MTDTNPGSFTWQNYIDVDEDVLPWMQITPAQMNSTRKSVMQRLVDMTCQWAQRKLGQPIAPTTFTKRFDGYSGWNGGYIMLQYYPVLQVNYVKEWWGTSSEHDLVESIPSAQVDGWQLEYPTGEMRRVFPGNVVKPWFPGSRNIEIQWEAGYDPVPADLQVASIEMVAHWWRNTQQGARRGMRAGGDDAETVAAGLWQGEPLRIVNLLESFEQVGIG